MQPTVKICGLSTADTLEAALDADAEHVGFVFFAASPRHIGLEQARALGAQVKGRAEKVALSVDADDATLAAIVDALRPDLLQLHGRETPERVRHIIARFGVPVMKVLPVATSDDLAAIAAYERIVDRLLFDAHPPKDASRPGGLGKPFDWHLLRGIQTAVPFMLSGGLNASNVAEALAITHAAGVDVSSGVESAPGVKDVAKIRAFIRAVRQAAGAEPMRTA